MKKYIEDGIYFETPTMLRGDHIIASNIRPATNEEVLTAMSIFQKTGRCNHRLIKDESGWPYDFRSCVICGKELGTI